MDHKPDPDDNASGDELLPVVQPKNEVVKAETRVQPPPPPKKTRVKTDGVKNTSQPKESGKNTAAPAGRADEGDARRSGRESARRSGRTDPNDKAGAEADKNEKDGKKKSKKKSLFRKLLPFIIIAAVLAAAYYLWSTTREEGFGPGFAGGNGRLEATEIDLATKLAGRIMQIHVDEGDYVQAGQELAVMQTNVLEAQRNEAIAQVVKARAAEASARAQIEVRISDVNAAIATVDQRASELDQTRRRLQRSTYLSQEGVITGQQYDDDETTEQAAAAAVDTARAQVRVAEAAVEAARADAEGAVAAVKAAEATVTSINADIADSHLVAPRNGRVQYRIVQPGEVLAAGGRVLNFVDLTDVYMNFFLPAEQSGQLPIGAEARILLDAFPDNPVPAHITYVAQTAQFTPKTVETESERQKLMFRVKAKVNQDVLAANPELVKPGLPGVAWVRINPNEPWPEQLAFRPGYGRAAPAVPAAQPGAIAPPAPGAAAAPVRPVHPTGAVGGHVYPPGTVLVPVQPGQTAPVAPAAPPTTGAVQPVFPTGMDAGVPAQPGHQAVPAMPGGGLPAARPAAGVAPPAPTAPGVRPGYQPGHFAVPPPQGGAR